MFADCLGHVTRNADSDQDALLMATVICLAECAAATREQASELLDLVVPIGKPAAVDVCADLLSQASTLEDLACAARCAYTHQPAHQGEGDQ